MAVNEKLFAFAEKHGLNLVVDGECGFGRPCVGFTDARSNYVDYNPCSVGDYKPIEGLQDDRHYEITPEDAYHKHDCMAVLNHGDRDKALAQLLEWVEQLETIGVEVVEYATGAMDAIQVMINGRTGYALKLHE
jgi:hypothetical protein